MIRTLAPALLLLTACGGPLVTAEFDAPEICQDIDQLSVPAAPAPVAADVLFDLPFVLPAELENLSSDVEVQLVGISAEATGVSDLSFIEKGSVTAGGDEVIADYARSPAASNRLEFKAIEGVNLGEVLTEKGAGLQTSLSGVFPQQPWTLRTRVCHRVVASAAFR